MRMVVDEPSLARAFASFTAAAASLERSYTQLQGEVRRLRQELEETNRDLARSLEENRRMRLHLDRILEGLPCGVLVMGPDGRVSIVNPEARRLLGADIGATLPGWLHTLLDQTKTGGELEYGDEPGNWMSIRRAQLTAENRGTAVCIVQDISGVKRMQQEHEVLLQRQCLAEMSAVLAHEVRNPLGSMELFTGLLAGSPLPPECQKWIEHLQAGLRTLSATVNNVLQFHSQPRPVLAPTDLGQLLRSVEQFLTPLAQRGGVQMQLEQDLDQALVAADRHRLEQVLLNLALNAFRAMPQGGRLVIVGKVCILQQRRNAVVRVSDTGPGIVPEALEHIFEPGFTTRPGSPGLGLAVCKTIMEQHRATIAVASAEGPGTTFVLEFPLVEQVNE